MRKYTLAMVILVIIVFASSLWLLSTSFSQQTSGKVSYTGKVSQTGKVKQPIDASATEEVALSKKEARKLGQQAARQFYRGQIDEQTVDHRLRDISDKELQKEFKRGYDLWKSKNIKEEEKQEE